MEEITDFPNESKTPIKKLFGHIRQLFLDLWSFESPDFG